MSSWTHHRARVAALSRDRAPDDPELLAARRDLAQARAAERRDIEAERLARYVRRVGDRLAEDALSPEECDRLALLFRGALAGTGTPVRRQRAARAAEAAAVVPTRERTGEAAAS